MNTSDVRDRLIEFLKSQTANPEIVAGTELLEDGIIDSLTMMDLMVFIESEFSVQLHPGDLNADVFRTPASLARLICERQGRSASAATSPQ